MGESCEARNDCVSGLACIRQRCVPENASLPITGKSCFRVECESTADCCSDFVPDPNCAIYDSNCQASAADCLAFQTLCVCNQTCDANRCIHHPPECTVDSHCGIGAERCVGFQCVQCAQHGDCANDTDRCVDGQCVAPCTADSECPLLSTCQNGTCVETGCTSDRECAFLLGDERGTCDAGSCRIGCTRNSECDLGAFEACVHGECVFVGCATDAECRALLDIQNEPTGVQAVCRAP